MPHDLATTNGQTAMMYAGQTLWHGLGTKLDEPATAAEALPRTVLAMSQLASRLDCSDL